MSTLLDQLRSLPSMVRLGSLAEEGTYSFSLLKGGLPQSGLIELSGPLGGGKTEVVLKFLSENSTLKTVWMESEFTFNPVALCKYQISLDQILFLDLSSPFLKQTPLWCASQAMKSGIFQVVVLFQLTWSEKDLRRLQLLSKDSGALVILLETNQRTSGKWAFTLQAEVRRLEHDLSPKLHILKTRHFYHGPE
jgi:hypothetical protein